MIDAASLQRLLTETAEGNPRALRELYEATSSHLYGVLVRILQRRDWAEEALQDCYLRLWRNAESYAPHKGAPLTWMQTIARYRALDLLRTKRPEIEMPEASPAAAPHPAAAHDEDPEVPALEHQGLGALSDCLDELSEEQRQSLLLAYYEGYTHGELARALRTPIGTVKRWTRQGLLQLRECLDG